ncbi:MAG: S41 family peptidase [Defluviitaleaceae bacterium]|nr:S41 family peptidase [Defluviitaleaceae bacterium]
MRKIFLITILILVMKTLTACGAEGEEHYEEAAKEDKHLFLADLEYLIYALENNFALLDVAYWARGFDMRAMAEDVRTDILANPEMDVDGFYDSLFMRLSPMLIANVAHFELVSPERHLYALRSYEEYRWFRAMPTHSRLQYPHVLAFYEPRHPEGDGTEPNVEAWMIYLAKTTDAGADFFIDRVALFGETQLAEDIAAARRAQDTATALALIDEAAEILINTPNVATEIIEEGRTAYLSVNSFMDHDGLWDEEKEEIHTFFEKIRDYDHLIIDLRRNRGGRVDYFTDIIMGPNIETNLQMRGYAFFGPGSYLVETFDQPFATMFSSGMLALDNRPRPIAEMLYEFDIPDLNMDDMRHMDYGFRTMLGINAGRLPRFDGQPAFNGQIWMLTGPQMGSATQIAAWVAKETDFATLVGEVTGGNYGGPRIFFDLPNSGILFRMDMLYVTDSRGRPLEAGTIPHYFNRLGMDALETVLSMIEEGW